MNSDPGLAEILLIGLCLVALGSASVIRSALLAYHSYHEAKSAVFETLQKHERAVNFAQFFGCLFSIVCAAELFLANGTLFSVQNLVLLVVIFVIILTISAILAESLQTAIRKSNTGTLLRGVCRFASFCGVLFIPMEFLLNVINRSRTANSAIEDGKVPANPIVALITEQRNEGRLNPEAFEMIEGVISMHEKMAREVMVARTDAFMVDIQNDNDRNIDAILQMPYSRVPVFNENKDNIVGIVHIKNILRTARKDGFDHVTIRRVMQPALFIPETMPIDEVMFEMQKTKNQIAILFDEYGGVVGLVTLEDLLEEIVGEIEDESDHPDRGYQKISDNEFIVQGKLALDDFNDEFGTALEMNEVDTIAGYMIAKLGFIPEDGSKVEFETPEHVVLVTEQVDDSRIMALRITLPPALTIAHVRREKSQANKG